MIGYVTLAIARRLARRRARRFVTMLRPDGARDHEGSQTMRKPNSARAAAGRATSLVESVRPIVIRAMNDPQLHEALRRALDTGREVTGEVSGKKPSVAARKLARDRRLQRRVEGSALGLQHALADVLQAPKKKKKKKRLGLVLVVVAGAGAAIAALVRRSQDGGGEDGAAG